MKHLTVSVVLLGVLAAPAVAELCGKCNGQIYIMSVGQCVECSGATGSGAFKLCKPCSDKRNQCGHCRMALRAGKARTAAAAKPKTEAEILAMIEAAGASRPKWWDSVKLTYPKTLDLTGTRYKPKKGANYHFGRYMASVIFPDPAKWQGGIKLLHHVADTRKAGRQKQMAMVQLAGMYLYLEGDYARTAYWWRQAIEAGLAHPSIKYRLAGAYLELGSKDMAVAALRESGMDKGTPPPGAIELWARLGRVELAEKLAGNLIANKRGLPAEVALGNMHRAAGDNAKAMVHYRKAVAYKQTGGHAVIYKADANVAMDTIKLRSARESVDLAGLADGVYTGVSDGFLAPIKVTVTVKAHKIVSLEITESKDTPRFFSRAKHFFPGRVVAAQSLLVDTVTGATVSCDGIINAATKALAKPEE